MAKYFHSLRSRITLFLTMLILLFCLLVAYNNYSAYSILRERVFKNTQDTLILYQKHMDDLLTRTDTYLYTIMLENKDFLNISQDKQTGIEYYATKYRLSKEFQDASHSYMVDGFFSYFSKSDTYIAYSNSTSDAYTSLKAMILEYISKNPSPESQWLLKKIDQSYIFIHFMQSGDDYIGAWVSMDSLLTSLTDEKETNSTIYFCTRDGELIRDNALPQTFQNSFSGAFPNDYNTLEEKQVLAVSQPLDHMDYALTMLIPAAEISGTVSSLWSVLLIVSLGFLCIWLFLFYFLQRWVQRPVRALTKASIQLKNGDLETKIPESNQLEEFQHMTDAFNEMVTEIKNLKIDVYEQQLEQQKLEMEYLKQQITPHFMINCLNSAYQLTEANHPELARQMLRALSDHLRYTLSSSQTVALGDELKLAANYIELSSIRYPGSILYYQECPETFYNYVAIPLLILNYIENTVKYEVTTGELLEIHVEITASALRPDTNFHICIWDTGGGFNPDMLKRLMNLEYYLEHEKYHIGLSNVILRARHIYDNPEFVFSNREHAGAQIDIELPIMHYPSNGCTK